MRPAGTLAPSLRGLAKIYDFRLGECPKYQRHPLSHGIRRDSSPRGGAKDGFAADGACIAKQQFTLLLENNKIPVVGTAKICYNAITYTLRYRS